MDTLTEPTTLALDRETAARLRRLAKAWRVTPEEVVRRAVETAEVPATKKPDPVEMLRAYHAKGGLDPAVADAWMDEVRENRKHWRGE